MSIKQTAGRLVEFLKVSFQDSGFTRAVIALSGGVDSSTSCALTAQTIGKENVYPLLLPYGNLNKKSMTDAWLVTKVVGIPKKNVTEKNIAPLVDPVLATDPTMDNVRRGNIMARVRMILLYDWAKKHNALVVGTENKTEHLLGYFTRFGDEASDIEPLRSLYKTEVYELAKLLKLPKAILTKAPTAGLWEGQTDEGEFGFTYKEADEILTLLVDKGLAIADVILKGYDRTTVEKVATRMKANNFKHNLPLVPL